MAGAFGYEVGHYDVSTSLANRVILPAVRSDPHARLVAPGLVTEVPYRVDVETESELTRGRTVVDLHGLRGLAPNVMVGTGIDRPRFIDLLVEAIERFA